MSDKRGRDVLHKKEQACDKRLDVVWGWDILHKKEQALDGCRAGVVSSNSLTTRGPCTFAVPHAD